VPANVQSARSAQIDDSPDASLAGFMNRRLGSVYLNEVQGNPFQPDVNFRGYTASPLLGSAQGLSVYMDGVRLNQPFGDVVSWDLLPKRAIASLVLMPGSNPLFGLNTLGGALAVQTKDGRTHPGTSLAAGVGPHRRVQAEFETGGANEVGLHWYGTVNRVHDGGWRAASPSDLLQAFAKVGHHSSEGDLQLTTAVARTALTGNGLQEQQLLLREPASVYTHPDTTRNRAALVNLAVRRPLDGARVASGNLYWRRLRTGTFNGDVNPDFLEDDDIAFNGLLNRTHTDQSHFGAAGQLEWSAPAAQSLLGLAADFSRSRFRQGSEFGTLTADRSVAGSGIAGGNDVDLAGRTRTLSVYGSTVLELSSAAHATLALRYNDTRVRNRDALLPGGGPGSLDGDHRFKRLNPALGATFKTEAFTLYAGANQGSRAPSAVELGCADPATPCKLPNAFAGDPPLAQVVATTVEAGLRRSVPHGASWSAGVFRSVNRNDLLFVVDDASGFGHFANVGTTRRQGIEAGASLPLGRRAVVSGNYTLLDATFRGGAGGRIPLVPRQMLKLSGELKAGAATSLGADLLAFGDAAGRGGGRNAGFAVVNVNAQYRPAPRLKLFAQIDNLLDRRYSTAAQAAPTAFDAAGRLAPARPSLFLAPGAPRALFVGLKYSLERAN
jgi:outer membrane receptor protein involved in Fe transport